MHTNKYCSLLYKNIHEGFAEAFGRLCNGDFAAFDVGLKKHVKRLRMNISGSTMQSSTGGIGQLATYALLWARCFTGWLSPFLI